MSHQAPDRVLLDLEGTSLTGIDPGVAERLKDLLGFSGESLSPYRRFDERILNALGIDYRRVGELIASGDTPVPGQPDLRVDIWGIVRRWTGQYWDIVQSPLRGASLADLRAFPWPDPEKVIQVDRLAEYRREARRLWEETDCVVVAEHPVFGVLELACWMCGFDDFLLRLAGDPEFVAAIFDKLLELQKAFIQPYYEAVGEYIHLTTSGDDFGTQIGPFMSPAMFRRWVKPYFSERIAFTHQFTRAFFWHHTCGSVHALIPDLLDCGVDILNPIQPGASHMEPERLKADFGGRLCFHGGFDTQNVLPFGSKADIYAEVARVMTALKQDGGYTFSAGHNIQSDVPAENVLIMYQAARELGANG
jgi:uroporphyrinogen decarboxylase